MNYEYLNALNEFDFLMGIVEEVLKRPDFNEFKDYGNMHFRKADGEVEIVVEAERNGEQYHWSFMRHKGDAFGRLRNNS